MLLRRGLGALLLACAVVLFLAADADAAKKRRKKAGSGDSQYFFTGTTPSGSTKWISDSAGSIYTKVDLSHLKFDRVPRFFCTVTADARRFGAGINATIETLHAANKLVNVTGKHKPTKVGTSGFNVRLRMAPGQDAKVSESMARLGGWRVRWVAILEGHSLFEAARVDVENEKYDLGIDEKPVGQALAYIKMLETFAKEEPSIMQGSLGIDYELPFSKRPKPAPKKPKKPATSADNATADGEAAKDGESSKETPEDKEEAKSDKSEAGEQEEIQAEA